MSTGTRPAVPAAVDWRFPPVHESRLDNGTRLLVYHCPGQYVVHASVLFGVPLNAEPPGRDGVAALTGRCLSRGAAGRDAEQFADALSMCGADLEAGAFPDGFSLRLAAPLSRLPAATGLMADVLREPAFAPAEFDHEQRLTLREIEQARAYPTHVAAERLNAALFGDARIARPVSGTEETVRAVTRDDVVDFAARHLRPDAATLVMAGDFADLDPEQVAADAFAGWHGGAAPSVPTEPRPVATTPRVLLVDWPGAPQSTLRLGGPGISRTDPRWPSMFVANYLIGGSFSSRTNQILREEKGVTYGVSTVLDSSRGAGVLGVSSAVRADATAEAVADIIAVLAEGAGTFSEEEVAGAARAITDSAVLGYERAATIAGRVELLLSHGLPLEHVDVNLQRVREVTAASANTAFGEVVAPDAMTVVVVGDAETVADPLRQWGYAEVEEVPSL